MFHLLHLSWIPWCLEPNSLQLGQLTHLNGLFGRKLPYNQVQPEHQQVEYANIWQKERSRFPAILQALRQMGLLQGTKRLSFLFMVDSLWGRIMITVPGILVQVNSSRWCGGKEFICWCRGDTGSIPGLGRSPGGGHGNPLQYSCLENPTDRSLAGYSPRDCKELDTTERMSMQHTALKLAKLLNSNISHLFSYRLLFKLNTTVSSKGNQPWIFTGRTNAEVSILRLPDVKSWLIGKDPDAGKDRRQEEKGTTEDEVVGWHHWLNGHELEQTLGDSEGDGSLACCSPWGHKDSDMTELLNSNSISCMSGKNYEPGHSSGWGKAQLYWRQHQQKDDSRSQGWSALCYRHHAHVSSGSLSSCRHPWISEQLREKHDRMGF